MTPLLAVALCAAPDLHAAAQKAFDEHHVAGMSVAIEKDGKLLLSEAFGFASLEHQVKVTPETVFHFDSCTKSLTTAAVLRLAEQKRLKLDDDVHKYVPGLTDPTPVTVRQLLNHTSGLITFDTLPAFEKVEREDVTPGELLKMLEGQPRYFKPGESWHYTNTGFWLAGQVIEKASGVGYAEYMRANIFEPAQMKTARVDVDRVAIVPHRADGYVRLDEGFGRGTPLSWVPVGSAGAISGTAADLLAFIEALDGGKLINKDSLARMRARVGPGRVEGALRKAAHRARRRLGRHLRDRRRPGRERPGRW